MRVLWNQISQLSPERQAGEHELCSGYEVEILGPPTSSVRNGVNERRSLPSLEIMLGFIIAGEIRSEGIGVRVPVLIGIGLLLLLSFDSL